MYTALYNKEQANVEKLNHTKDKLISSRANLKAKLQNIDDESKLNSLRIQTFSDTSSNVSGCQDFNSNSPGDTYRRKSFHEKSLSLDKHKFASEANLKLGKQRNDCQDVITKKNTLYELYLQTVQLFDGRSFKLIDVRGDGNCFFKSLIKCGHFSVWIT